jgi:hypothetical protein
MGVLTDRLDQLVLTIQSADGQISATLSNRDQVELSFTPGAYRRYDEPTLAYQLTRLAAAMRVESRRRCRAALRDATGPPFREETVGHASMSYPEHRAMAALEVEAWSGSGCVGFWTRGMTHWNATIAPGTLRVLTQHEFAAEVMEAVRTLLTDYRRQALRLTDPPFDRRPSQTTEPVAGPGASKAA